MESEKLAVALQEMQANVAYLIAKTDHEKTKLATQNVTSIFQATQAAGTIAQNPGIAAPTDEILKSAGFVDYNEAPVVSEVENPQPFVEPAVQNTSPGLPPVPATGRGGIMKGIETPE